MTSDAAGVQGQNLASMCSTPSPAGVSELAPGTILVLKILCNSARSVFAMTWALQNPMRLLNAPTSPFITHTYIDVHSAFKSHASASFAIWAHSRSIHSIHGAEVNGTALLTSSSRHSRGCGSGRSSASKPSNPTSSAKCCRGCDGPVVAGEAGWGKPLASLDAHRRVA